MSDDRSKNIELAIKQYELSQTVFTKKEYPKDWGELQSNLGNVYTTRIAGNMSENIDLSIQYHRHALEVISNENNPIEWINICLNLINSYIAKPTLNRVENLQQAQNIISELLNYISKEKYPLEWAKSHASLGLLFSENPQGLVSENQIKSINEYDISMEVFSLENHPLDWATTQNNKGNIYVNFIEGDIAENIEKAIILYKEALKVRTKFSYPKEWADTTSNLAIAFTRRIRGDRERNIDGAIKLFNDVLKVRTKKDFPLEWANTQCNLSNAYAECLSGNREDNIEAAIEALNLALNVYRKEEIPFEWSIAKHNLGLLYMKRLKGDLNENNNQSVSLFESCLEVINKISAPNLWATTQLNLGLIYYKCANNKDEKYLNFAINSFNLALEVFTSNTYPENCKHAAFKCGQSYCLLDNWNDARKILEISHNATEILRQQFSRADSKSKLSDNSIGLYQLLIHACIKVKDYNLAFYYVQAIKGRTDIERLYSLQSLEELVQHYPELSPQFDHIKKLQSKLDSIISIYKPNSRSSESYSINKNDFNRSGNTDVQIEWEINSIRQEIKTKLENISYQFPISTAIQYSPVFEIESAIILSKKTKSVLVEFFEHPATWMAYVVNGDQFTYVPLPDVDSSTINSVVEILNLFKQGKVVNDLFFFEKLYKELWEPLISYLPKDGSIVIAPHSILYSIPIGALQADKLSKFLFEQYTLTMVSSISFFSAIYEQSIKAEKTNKNSKLLSVVYAGSNKKSQDYLSNVEGEAIEIAKNFKETISLFSEEATPDKVIQNSNQYIFDAIHFGCHGNFDKNDPNFSGLKINGTLSVHQIINRLRFNYSPLVTLAACQTGLVGQTSGGDLVGLTQSFFIAGASNVIATLWPVKDDSTREILELFYKKRKEEGVNNSQALQYSINEIRSKSRWKNPLYWAAFQIFGLPV